MTDTKPSLFDEMLKNKEYSDLFDSLPADEKPILMQSVRKFVEQFEKALGNITEKIDKRT